MQDLLAAPSADKTTRAIIAQTPAPCTEAKSSAWNWRDDAADIVLHEQPQTAVYVNASGSVSVRQIDNHGNDDGIVTVLPALAKRLCDAILACAREAGGADALA